MNAQPFVSVICEYNPFHYGHEYQIQQLKKEFESVVCIMSGNIVQRGTFAIADKYIRATAALNCGADLVLELPLPWCCASASDFARAGVFIAEAIGSDYLAFGAEDGTETLMKIREVASKKEFSDTVSRIIEENKNISYPNAFSTAISEFLGKEYAEAVKKPNNILANEYISSLSGRKTKPFVVRREQEFSSSSAIRAENDGGKMLSLIPEKSREAFENVYLTDFPRDMSKLDSFFIGTLRNIAHEGKAPENIYSAPEGLIQKILLASVKVSSFESLVTACTDKIYTSARVRRAVIALVFGITTDRVKQNPCYTQVLAANGRGREILKAVKNQKSIDIITKPVHALSLGNMTKEAFLFSKKIEDIVSLSSPVPTPANEGKSPVITK